MMKISIPLAKATS